LKPLILVVDADAAACQRLKLILRQAGYSVETAANGLQGSRLFEKRRPDFVLTELALPLGDGFGLIGAVRQIDQTPIMVISSRSQDEDKIHALDLGADDYMTKPFSEGELLARVRALFRRSGIETVNVLHFPDLVIDLDRHIVVQAERTVHLTPSELKILALLARSSGRPVSLRQVAATAWKGKLSASYDTIRVHVASLRRKLEPDPANPRYIGTVPHVGYRFLADPTGD
jgi:two-component system KDP operon response regulator KdpE